jgi:hypothetical protein
MSRYKVTFKAESPFQMVKHDGSNIHVQNIYTHPLGNCK